MVNENDCLAVAVAHAVFKHWPACGTIFHLHKKSFVVNRKLSGFFVIFSRIKEWFLIESKDELRDVRNLLHVRHLMLGSVQYKTDHSLGRGLLLRVLRT